MGRVARSSEQTLRQAACTGVAGGWKVCFLARKGLKGINVVPCGKAPACRQVHVRLVATRLAMPLTLSWEFVLLDRSDTFPLVPAREGCVYQRVRLPLEIVTRMAVL